MIKEIKPYWAFLGCRADPRKEATTELLCGGAALVATTAAVVPCSEVAQEPFGVGAEGIS